MRLYSLAYITKNIGYLYIDNILLVEHNITSLFRDTTILFVYQFLEILLASFDKIVLYKFTFHGPSWFDVIQSSQKICHHLSLLHLVYFINSNPLKNKYKRKEKRANLTGLGVHSFNDYFYYLLTIIAYIKFCISLGWSMLWCDQWYMGAMVMHLVQFTIKACRSIMVN